MKYTLAVIALLGLTENTEAINVSKHRSHKHQHKKHHNMVQMVDDGEKNPDAPEVEKAAPQELTADEKAAREKAAKIER